MSIKQKSIFDAGVATGIGNYPKNYQVRETSHLTITNNPYNVNTLPKSPYAISETRNLVFTNNGLIGNTKEQNLNIADGERRPGSTR